MQTFTARRSKAELVAPARPTPHETKALSDVDNFYHLRYYAAAIEFFRRRPTGGQCPDDPAKAVKVALAEALVHYYPIAGRLREVPDGKLVVDCTAEGVVFVEADADVRLEDFGEPLSLPYPCVEEFFCTGNFKYVVGRPLFFMQVTRLRCGGFAIGFHICHNIADGVGMIQFIKAIVDLARGEAQPGVLPVWERQLLTARIPPRIRPDMYPAYELSHNGGSTSAVEADVMRSTPIRRMVSRYFLFGPREIAALRGHVPEHLRRCTTTFELLTAVMWRCRTMALGYQASERVRILLVSSARGRWNHDLHIPQGYYGNAFACPTVETTVDELCGRPLGHALQLVHKAKLDLTLEKMRSMVDAMALLRARPLSAVNHRVYEVSDIRHVGDDRLDFGWAQWVGGGIPVPRLTSFHMKCKNGDGEDAVAVSMLLPGPVMERFSEQMAFWLNNTNGHKFTLSSL